MTVTETHTEFTVRATCMRPGDVLVSCAKRHTYLKHKIGKEVSKIEREGDDMLIYWVGPTTPSYIHANDEVTVLTPIA